MSEKVGPKHLGLCHITLTKTVEHQIIHIKFSCENDMYRKFIEEILLIPVVQKSS